MYEKNIYDWSIYKASDFKKNGFNISIGTYSNSYLSIVDCLGLLALSDKENKSKFLKYLERENKKHNWFNAENKKEHKEYIKKNGINPYCFLNIDDFINSFDDCLEETECLKEDTIKNFIDNKENHLKLIIAIDTSENITELYLKIIEIKTEFFNELHEDFYSFVEPIELF